jgi:hypothetical protein
MGHTGSTGSITLDVYSKTWWDERVEAVNWIVEAVFSEPDEKDAAPSRNSALEKASEGEEWEPFGEPNAV